MRKEKSAGADRDARRTANVPELKGQVRHGFSAAEHELVLRFGQQIRAHPADARAAAGRLARAPDAQPARPPPLPAELPTSFFAMDWFDGYAQHVLFDEPSPPTILTTEQAWDV